MSAANDDAGRERKRLRPDDDAANFVYTGQENVPGGVICVRIHPSIKVIRARAFFRQTRLMSVELHDGLEVIEEQAFQGCGSLQEMLFPPSVRAIKDFAFCWCSGLTAAIFNDGLEVIETGAFYGCAFERIDIPPSVKAIKCFAFRDCSGLTTAILNDGLEEIGEGAFSQCAFESIVIPPTVKEIDETAFRWCSNLTSVQFCDEIEEFVSGELMRHWWNHGVHEKCLSTYCLLIRFNIPKCVGLVRSITLQTNIHGMLERIPFISPESLNAHFDSIDSKLYAYERGMWISVK